MEIRRYQPTDLAAVWALHVIALEHAGAYAEHGPWDDDLHHIEAVYLHNRGEFLVGIEDGRLAAMGAIRYTDDERAEVKRMRVQPEM